MPKMSMVGRTVCAEGQSDDMEAALAAMVAASEEEDGNTYWFFALFSSEEAMKAHGQGPKMSDAMPAFGALMAAPPEMSSTVPIYAKGLGI